MGTPGNRSKNSLLILTTTAGVWSLACVMALALIEGHASGQCVEHKLLASDGAVGDVFGRSVSISGPPGNEVAIVGAFGDDDNGFASGSAYIYRFNGVNWVEEAKLLASDGAVDDLFGRSVSISGTPGNEVAIVGAWLDDDNGTDSGSVYIYRFNGVIWVEEAKLIASDGAASDRFGKSVSISGAPGNEVAIVGAPRDDDNGLASGSVYIYRFNGVNWVEEQKLLAPDGAMGDGFYIVSISGDVALVGALGDDDNGDDSGSAYIYRFNGVNWVEEQKLIASVGVAWDNFGFSVSITGAPGNEVAIVGAYNNPILIPGSGSAYIYRFNGVNWVEEAKLLASDGTVSDSFGWSVSISGTPGNEVAIVGAWLDDDNGTDSGSVYIYRFNGVIWVEEQKLIASDGAADDEFGYSVSISNDIAFIGASGDKDNGFLSGSVYIFELTCPADTNCNGEVNVTDLLQLLWNWGPCPAPCPPDTNTDGAVNVTDLLTLLAAWGPCPAP